MAPYVPREGLFTLDVLVLIIKKTLLNPKITLPVFLALRYTPTGQQLLGILGARGANALFKLKLLLVLGLVERVNRFLSRRSSNNWTKDKFVPANEIVVVTGGSSGIGASIVADLTSPGRGIKAIVVLDVQPLMYEAASNVHFYEVDLSSPFTITATCARIREEVGNPTVLINNAGICRGKNILDSSAADIALTFAVNTTSHFLLVKEFLPAMIAANHGHIVTVTSIAAYVVAPQMVDYSASKAAAHSFHEGLGVELKFIYGAPKVRTTLVSQGYVKTPLFAGFKNEAPFMSPALAPETLAEAIVEKVLEQQGGHVVLPRFSNVVTGSRGWSTWVQNGMRGRTHDVMKTWHGKQVL